MSVRNSKLVIYQTEDGQLQVKVRVYEDTVWLTQSEISDLFGKDRTVISKHIKNILEENELDSSVCAKFAHTASDGKTYNIQYYNLDMIISVGYRVKSKNGIAFRKWSSTILKEYLIEGYAVNQDRLNQEKIHELQQTIELLSQTLVNENLVTDLGASIISIIRNYTKTWDVLVRYDEDNLVIKSKNQSTDSNNKIVQLEYEAVKKAISDFRIELGEKSTNLFGLERGDILRAILGNIRQSFGGVDLYPTLADKAAHLLYFIIKDHPFSDGNKRIGCLLFLLYLHLNNPTKNEFIGNIGMTSLAILIAQSQPDQKEIIIKLIVNLITGQNQEQ